jgi:uncharacterized protein Yka (UPF0111/DUF47 family)
MSNKEEVMKRIENLEEKIDNIQTTMNIILEKLERLDTTSTKMGNHIEFVEGVYDNFKRPLSIIKSRIENVFGTGEIQSIE